VAAGSCARGCHSDVQTDVRSTGADFSGAVAVARGRHRRGRRRGGDIAGRLGGTFPAASLAPEAYDFAVDDM